MHCDYSGDDTFSFCGPEDVGVCWPLRSTSIDLEGAIGGSVVWPSDPGFFNLTLQNNRFYEKMPAVIVLPSNAADVVTAVRFAKARRMHVSVSSGRHAYDGQGVATDTVHIDMRNMNKVSPDASNMRVHIEMGAIFEKVYAEVDKVGKLFVGGSCPTVALGGFMSAGGTSVNSRMKGLGADSALSLRVVTAAGELVDTSPTINPELFWALLGGGGNFGIVVDGVWKLHEPPPEYTALSLDFFFELPTNPHCGTDVLTWFKEFMPSLPREWSIYVVVDGGPGYAQSPGRISSHDILGHFSTRPLLEAAARHKNISRVFETGILSFHGLFWGSLKEAEAAIRPLLEQHPECQVRNHVPNILRTISSDETTVSTEPLTSFKSFLEYQVAGHKAGCSISGGLGCADRMTSVPLLPTLDLYDEDFVALFKRVARATELMGETKSSGISIMWTALGGAASQPNPNISAATALRTAFGNAAINVYWNDATADAKHVAFSRSLANDFWHIAKKNHVTATGYLGYPSTDGMPNWRKAYYGHNYARLLHIKRAWDPFGVFEKFEGVGYKEYGPQPIRNSTNHLRQRQTILPCMSSLDLCSIRGRAQCVDGRCQCNAGFCSHGWYCSQECDLIDTAPQMI